MQKYQQVWKKVKIEISWLVPLTKYNKMDKGMGI